jgi:hypothetical protein
MSFAGGIVDALRAVVRSVFRTGSGDDSSGRTLLHDAEGKLVAIGGHQRTEPGQLSGAGVKMSAPLRLTRGAYRIEYQFQVHTRLAIVDDEGEETLTMGVGAGTIRMGIPQTGTYRLLMEPIDKVGTWTVIYRPVD